MHHEHFCCLRERFVHVLKHPRLEWAVWVGVLSGTFIASITSSECVKQWCQVFFSAYKCFFLCRTLLFVYTMWLLFLWFLVIRNKNLCNRIKNHILKIFNFGFAVSLGCPLEWTKQITCYTYYKAQQLLSTLSPLQVAPCAFTKDTVSINDKC